MLPERNRSFMPLIIVVSLILRHSRFKWASCRLNWEKVRSGWGLWRRSWPRRSCSCWISTNNMEPYKQKETDWRGRYSTWTASTTKQWRKPRNKPTDRWWVLRLSGLWFILQVTLSLSSKSERWQMSLKSENPDSSNSSSGWSEGWGGESQCFERAHTGSHAMRWGNAELHSGQCVTGNMSSLLRHYSYSTLLCHDLYIWNPLFAIKPIFSVFSFVLHSKYRVSKNTSHGYFQSPPLFWQIKEEEAKQLRISLEQQREEAKSREEELHQDASEKVFW